MSHRLRLIAAFFAIYVLWGSAYLAIRYAVETIPPFMMTSARFLIGGAILYLGARWQGAPTPTRPQWRAATLAGALFLVGGLGSIGWAQQYISSSLAALLIATTPLWMVTLEWLWQGAARPSPAVMLGIVTGLLGIALLIGPGSLVGEYAAPVTIGGIDGRILGALVVLGAALSWTLGTLYSRSAPHPTSPLMTTGIQMLTGGTLLGLLGLFTDEASHFNIATVSSLSLLALTYLIIVALIGFTAYNWLLRVTSATRAATYAYVNPVVAVGLGWALGGEEITTRILLAMVIIVASVALITVTRGGGPSARRLRSQRHESSQHV